LIAGDVMSVREVQEGLLEGKHVYGGTFVALLKALKKMKGMDAINTLMKDLKRYGYTAPLRIEDYKLKKKYELSDYLLFFDRCAELFGRNTTDEMSREGAKKEGIWGWFVKLAGTPELVMKNAGRYWKEFYDFGEMRGEMVDNHTARLYLRDGCFTEVLCSAHTAYFAGVMESIGKKNVRVVHEKCTLRGDEMGVWKITWD